MPPFGRPYYLRACRNFSTQLFASHSLSLSTLSLGVYGSLAFSPGQVRRPCSTVPHLSCRISASLKYLLNLLRARAYGAEMPTAG